MDNRVVNVRTQEQWDIVTKELGYKWEQGKWMEYNEGSCIYLGGKCYDSMEYCLNNGRDIITFEKWQEEINASKKENKSFEELQKLVIQWAENKGILFPENHLKQFAKFISEAGELGDAIIKNDIDSIEDSFGDSLICIIILAGQLGYDLNKCLETAYNVIAKRTGKTENGVFIKD